MPNTTSQKLALLLALGTAVFGCQDTEPQQVKRDQRIEAWATDILGEGFGSYRWELLRPYGSEAELSADEGDMTEFQVDVFGLYQLRVYGYDGRVIGSDVALYEATNYPPQVFIQAPQTSYRGFQVMAFNYVRDLEGDFFELTWTVSDPAGASVDFTFLEPGGVSFVTDLVGTYRITLTATVDESTSTTAVAYVESLPPRA